MNRFEEWCHNLKQYWQEQNIEMIISLFDENVIYYESPKMKLNSIAEVREQWEDIKEQNTSTIEVKILCTGQNKCIANYILTDEVSYDMIYEIELNKENKCTYFKQWYMEF